MWSEIQWYEGTSLDDVLIAHGFRRDHVLLLVDEWWLRVLDQGKLLLRYIHRCREGYELLLRLAFVGRLVLHLRLIDLDGHVDDVLESITEPGGEFADGVVYVFVVLIPLALHEVQEAIAVTDVTALLLLVEALQVTLAIDVLVTIEGKRLQLHLKQRAEVLGELIIQVLRDHALEVLLQAAQDAQSTIQQ